ncbi:hypothetical protein ACLOJK_024076 [Asimina triloba]
MAAEVSAKLKGTSIFLVGMSGNMKTSTGKILSEALRYYYFDSDGLIEQAAGGKSSAKEFREKDEEGYRNSEHPVYTIGFLVLLWSVLWLLILAAS